VLQVEISTEGRVQKVSVLSGHALLNDAAIEAVRQWTYNMRSGMTSDAAWASFAYTLDSDGAKKLGLATMVFKKVGTDWQIVLVHAAANHPATHTPIP
jgi:TonB family protein